MPQWVISNGPLELNCGLRIFDCEFETTLTSAFSTERPSRPLMRSSFMLKVNSDATGGTIMWPSSSNIFQTECDEPAVTTTTSASILPVLVFSWNLESVYCNFSTPHCILTCTPRRRASFQKQSIIVCDESVTGNIRPSASRLISTPRLRNQSIVFEGLNFVKGPSNCFSPRG